MPCTPTWFITGCSSGFGAAIARAALEAGCSVVATARDISALASLKAEFPGALVPLRLDVTRPLDISNAVNTAVERLSRIDVLVNNAGIGYLSSVEDGDDEIIRRMFDVNFFGLAEVTRRVLPKMRGQKSGLIINMSSGAGVYGLAGMGYYCASKFAIEGFSEALALEVAPLGIDVLVVEPGPFRTEFLGRSMQITHASAADYEASVGSFIAGARSYHGKESGDPARAARALVRLVLQGDRPLRVPLGDAVVEPARAKYRKMIEMYTKWEHWAQAVTY